MEAGWKSLEELRFCVDEHLPPLPEEATVPLTNLKILRIAFRNRRKIDVDTWVLASINCPKLEVLEVEGVFTGILFPLSTRLKTLIFRPLPGSSSPACTITVHNALNQYRLSLDSLSLTGPFDQPLNVNDPEVVMPNLKTLHLMTNGEKWLKIRRLENLEQLFLESCLIDSSWMDHCKMHRDTQFSLRELTLRNCRVEEYQLELFFQHFAEVTKVVLETVEVYAPKDPFSTSLNSLTSGSFYSYWATCSVFSPKLQHIEFHDLFTRNGSVISNLVKTRREKFGGRKHESKAVRVLVLKDSKKVLGDLP